MLATARIVHAIAALSLAVLTSSPMGFGQQAPVRRNVTLHITDFGINQPWNAEMRVGDPFYEGQQQLFDLLGNRSQVLVPMPSDKQMELPVMELSRLLAESLITAIDQKLATGLVDFELQLVQHIGVLGYPDSHRQAAIAKFGEAAYSAIATLIRHIKAENRNVAFDVTAGSNGTVALAAGARHLAPYKDDLSLVELVDGRASRREIAETISLFDPGKIRIINTRGDFFAPPWSIGNYDATRSLKAEFPGITSLLITSRTRGLTHIQWMVNPHQAFDVTETVLDANGTGKLPLGPLSFVDVRDENTFNTARSSAMAIRRTAPSASAEDLADELDRLARNLDTLKDFVEATETIGANKGLVPLGFSLIPATLRDEADRIRFGDRSWLVSHKIEAIATECLDHLQAVIGELITKGFLPKSYTFLSRINGATIAEVAKAIGTGHFDVTGWTRLLDDISKYTASITLRLLLSPLGPKVANWAADATESFVEMALPVARATTTPLFRDFYGDPVRKSIIDQWITAQNRRIANGQAVQTLHEMYGDQLLAQAGFEGGYLAQNAEDTKWFNSVVAPPNGGPRNGTWHLKLLRRNSSHLTILVSIDPDRNPPGATSADDNSAGSSQTEKINPRDCLHEPCVPVQKKKLDAFPPCPPGLPGCGCPPGTPGCAETEAATIIHPCPPNDPECNSPSPLSGGLPSCPPKCDDPPEAALAALFDSNWKLLAEILGSDGRFKRNPITRLLLAHALAALNHNGDAHSLFMASRAQADIESYHAFAAHLVSSNALNSLAQFIYGDAIARRGNYALAQTVFDRAISMNPPTPLPIYARGVVKALSGDNDGAIVDITRATKAEPTLGDIWLSQAILCLQLDGLSGAQTAISQSVKYSQDSALIHIVLGMVAQESGDTPTAQTEMIRAGQIDALLKPAITDAMGPLHHSVPRPPVSALSPPDVGPLRIGTAPALQAPRPEGGVTTKEIGDAPIDRGKSRWTIPFPLFYEPGRVNR
jgi:Flp pilus assembly protein TadD